MSIMFHRHIIIDGIYGCCVYECVRVVGTSSCQCNIFLLFISFNSSIPIDFLIAFSTSVFIHCFLYFYFGDFYVVLLSFIMHLDLGNYNGELHFSCVLVWQSTRFTQDFVKHLLWSKSTDGKLECQAYAIIKYMHWNWDFSFHIWFFIGISILSSSVGVF